MAIKTKERIPQNKQPDEFSMPLTSRHQTALVRRYRGKNLKKLFYA
jgi:hypothetical protein